MAKARVEFIRSSGHPERGILMTCSDSCLSEWSERCEKNADGHYLCRWCGAVMTPVVIAIEPNHAKYEAAAKR
jgi:hypothetical protein